MAVSRISNASVVYDRHLAYVIDREGKPIATVLVHGDNPHQNDDTPAELVFTYLPGGMTDPQWSWKTNRWSDAASYKHKGVKWLERLLWIILTLALFAANSFGQLTGTPVNAGALQSYVVSTVAPTNGQCLTWVAAGPWWIPGACGSASPLTTKGDIYTFTTVDARLTVGANGLCLTADSTTATGLAWATCGSGAAHNLLSATHSDTVAASPVLGDILYGDVAPAWTKLAGNTTATKNFLTQTGTGAVSAVPAWGAIASGDLPSHTAALATALAANPADCAANQHAISIAANGDLTCASALLQDLGGAVTDAQVPDTITVTLAATATALAANGANCGAGSYPLGVGADGAVESCTDYGTETKTLTNKTLNVESTGNAITTVTLLEYQAGLSQAGTASSACSTFTSAAPAATSIAGSATIPILGTLAFDATSDEYIQCRFWAPDDWTGAIDIDFYWRATSTAGETEWCINTISVADAETLGPTFGAAACVNDTAKGTTLQVNLASRTGINVVGIAANELVFIKVFRNADASDEDSTIVDDDDMTGDAELISFRIRMRRAQ